MSHMSESFEEYFNDDVRSLEVTIASYNLSRHYSHRKFKELLEECWNHQQKKIDGLIKDNDGLSKHMTMLVKQKRNAIEKLQSAEEENRKLEKEIKDYQEGWLGCCHTCEPVAIKNKWQNEVIHRLSEKLDFALDRFDTLLGGEAGMKHIREYNKEIKKELRNER